MSQERYLRHSLIDWFSQDKLVHTRAVVIGAGAVGNEVVKNLALLGVGEIRIYDFDTIEAHNLTRSVLFRESDIGKAKATVSAERAQELDPNVKVEAVIGDFWDQLSILEMKTFDVVFCCVDNFEARIRCNLMCQIARVDFVNIGIDSRFALVEQYPFSRNIDGGCYECNLPPSVYQRMSEKYSCGHLRKVSVVERKVPTTIVTSSAAASLAVSAGLRLGANHGAPDAKRYYLDTIDGHLTRITLERVPGCPCCDRFAQDMDIVQCLPTVGKWANAQADLTVIASDPILVGYRIGSDFFPLFLRADGFDSGYPSTLADDPGKVGLEIRDQFSADELVSRFASYKMPCKFALVLQGNQPTIFEFREQ